MILTLLTLKNCPIGYDIQLIGTLGCIHAQILLNFDKSRIQVRSDMRRRLSYVATVHRWVKLKLRDISVISYSYKASMFLPA